MSKMYYVSYETAKEQLNLISEEEAQDRMSLAMCNQLVKNALEDVDSTADEKQKSLEAIVLRAFNKYKSYKACNERELVEIYSAIKDTLVWV